MRPLAILWMTDNHIMLAHSVLILSTRSIAMINVKLFPYKLKQTRGNEFSPLSTQCWCHAQTSLFLMPHYTFDLA